MVAVSMENPLMRTYVVHATILALKVLIMALLTARIRIKKSIFANPEDAATAGSKGKVKFDDSDIERVRRSHLNDLENIPMFFIIGFLYILTDPSVRLATTLFRLVTAARFLHTLVYAIFVVPQPARFLAHFASYITMWYMGVMVVMHFLADL